MHAFDDITASSSSSESLRGKSNVHVARSDDRRRDVLVFPSLGWRRTSEGPVGPCVLVFVVMD